MSLFPAYATPMPDGSELPPMPMEVKNGTTGTEDKDEEERLLSKSEEEELLTSKTSPSCPSTGSEPESKIELKHTIGGKEKKRKRDKKKKKDRRRSVEDLAEPLNVYADFYIDNKIDYGNMRVSTLYNPARPRYERRHVTVGDYLSKSSKRRRNAKRYFNAAVNYDYKDSEEDNESESTKKKPKATKNFISIGAGDRKKWTGEDAEKILLNRTAEFSKNLESNPYDVDAWLEYVKFQEERLAHDLANRNVASAATIRSHCYEKQLSILDSALKHNFNSLKLLYTKVKISERSMTHDKYLAMLTNLLTTQDLSNNLLIRGWLWNVDAIKYSMALCSVRSVKEVYTAAIKGLHKAQRQSYQGTHVDITYRLGLFLRQAGLWEELWMLLKMNLETNLAASRAGGSFEFEATPIDVGAMLDEERNIIQSGLPTHEVWSRIELVRSRLQWLPAKEEAVDPQRNVFSTDFADFIKPISNKSHMFVLTVNMLRLLKIPLLPLTDLMPSVLNVTTFAIDWELDCIEWTLPFFYHSINGMDELDANRLRIITRILKDFIQEPNYIDMSSDYFKFVNNVMLQCAQWFDGNEKTAILVWWIRFLQTVLAIHISIYSFNETTKAIVQTTKKSVKELLKSNRDDIIMYKEYSILEAQISGVDKGATIMGACLQALPNERNIARVHLTRSYVELILRKHSKVQNNVSKCVATLVSLVSDVAIADSSTIDEDCLNDSIKKYSHKTERLLGDAASYDSEPQLVELMLPDLTVDWISCHGWLLVLTRGPEDLKSFFRRVLASTYVLAGDRSHRDSRRKLRVREGLVEWAMAASEVFPQILVTVEDLKKDPKEVDLWERSVVDFPHNSYIVWHMTTVLNQKPSTRWKLSKLVKCDEPSPMLALAVVLQNFVELYKKNDPSYADLWQPGHSNRLLNTLTTMVNHPMLKKCSLIWHMLIEFVASHTEASTTRTKKYLYQALDECPWNKELYFIGCIRAPSEFFELLDIMVAKQLRVHTMPEELNLNM